MDKTDMLCESCAPDSARTVDIIENPFATCDRCGIAAEDAGTILEVRN